MTANTREKIQPKTIYLKDYQLPDYVIENCDLEFNLNEEFTLVKSHLKLHANKAVKHPAKNLRLDGEALTLVSVTLNQKTLSPSEYEVTPEALTIFNVPDQFTLDIVTQIKPQENTTLSGLYKSSGNFCTQCEAHGFRRITYFLDRPDAMTRFTTKIIANKKQYPILLSNGNPIAQGELDNGRHWVQWEDPFKKPCYLFALVAGDLDFIEDSFITQSGRKISLRIYVEKGNRDKCDHAMRCVKAAMRWDEEKFGREYDLDIYMIVAVSDFNMGAMENKGLNIFNTKYILAKPDSATDQDFIYIQSVIGHEYFHNWTGNRITCRDWFQLSIKEGLTIFRDQSFTADMTSRTVARIDDVNALRTVQFPEDAGPLAHPVQPSSYIEINNFYTTTIYNKGAEVIRMMQTILGADLFRRGMDLYFSQHDGEAVTIEEFIKAMETVSNIDLSQFRLWYSQAGTPIVEVTDHYDEEKETYTLTFKQTMAATPGQPHKKPMYIPIKMGLLDASGKELVIENKLFNLKQVTEQIEFKNIKSRPIPSLLRHFSAPVKIRYAYSDKDLQVLFKHDTDGFNRWEAGQTYAVNCLLRMIDEYKKGKPLQVPSGFIETFQYILTTQKDDKLLLSRLLTLPSEKYLCEQMETIDIDAIHAAREFLLIAIAKALQEKFVELYQHNQTTSTTEFNMHDVGGRQLKNLALFYLMKLPDFLQYGVKQFNAALDSNMTDTMAALRCLVDVKCPERDKALADFYTKWQADALAVDKWFTIQAMSILPDTLNSVIKLTHHQAFDIKNPNKVYALIRAFAQGNLSNFHVKDGGGYVFLKEIVCKLNDINPQIAARIVVPLTEWRRYDSARQKLMREQLELIAEKPHLSKDVYELVIKSLKGNLHDE